MYCLYVSACVPKKHLSMSKVNLIWTRAIRPVIAQSAQFGEIAFSQIHFSEARAQWSTMGKKIW